MKNWISILTFAIAACLCNTANAIIINFDDVSSGTIIDNQYPDMGIVFSTTGDRSDSHAYALENPYSTSNPNIIGCISTSPWLNYDCKGMATFPSLLSNQVGVYAIPEKTYTTNWAWMKAYDSSGILLETVEASNILGEAELLYIDRPALEIAYVEFMAKGNRHVYFDDFSFDSVPEPSTLILLGSGLAGLAFARRRMKK